jgi:hypothetical protein
MTGLWKLNLIAAFAIGSFATAGGVAAAIEPAAGQPAPRPVGPAAGIAAPVNQPAVATTDIDGLVVDEAGAPLAGAVISVIGPTATLALTDQHGKFVVPSLPSGRYALQARKVGRNPSPLLTISLNAHAGAHVRLTLVPPGKAAPEASAIVEYPVLAAGFVPGSEQEAEAGHPSNPRETAWRLRHLRRSVLKDADQAADVATDDSVPTESWFSRVALDQRPSIFADFGDFSSLSGQINLMTVGSFDNPQQIFSADGFSHGVAYLSIGSSPADRTAWTVRGAMTEGDFASWVLSGTYAADLGDHHRYQAAMVYGTQRPDRTSALAVDRTAEGGRDLAILHGLDTWTVSRQVAVAYGVDYTRYDYAGTHGLLDPRASLTLKAGRGLVIRASASRQSVAPGSEELMAPTSDGIWLPPQHAVVLVDAATGVAPERAQMYRVEAERSLSPDSNVRVGVFYQQVSDQVATLFGLESEPTEGMPRYFVGDGGDVTARGYDVSLTHAITSRIHGSVTYTVSTADWSQNPGLLLLADVAPSVVRQGTERLQDVSTSLETDIPESATHVLMLYRINTGFAARDENGRPGIGYRFDVRVTQGLPFLNFSGTEWQALVGVRNFFRDASTTASGYDELLVVRPPKRIVGGLMLRF